MTSINLSISEPKNDRRSPADGINAGKSSIGDYAPYKQALNIFLEAFTYFNG